MISEAVKTGRSVKIAAVQAASVAFDLDASLDKLHTLTRRAAGDGADLIVFPEAFLSGYPRGLTFGATVGSRPRCYTRRAPCSSWDRRSGNIRSSPISGPAGSGRSSSPATPGSTRRLRSHHRWRELRP